MSVDKSPQEDTELQIILNSVSSDNKGVTAVVDMKLLHTAIKAYGNSRELEGRIDEWKSVIGSYDYDVDNIAEEHILRLESQKEKTQ